ncbi:hypothetical protein A9P82_09290 [Arachidicoccus ginsenosidimutans]|uniref:TetR/AcrR family transcriptional regulator n=1 Tax=Arachidicoccus sp. BS20 TaxID=1850526 RepID=UPI0007F0D248|nr:TetR/AcrR family transcriptional regulator [Arachidicoccus sp. BS20]ANI89469.1 hypothetical protein A9P82_09290 [Arachidicoccus sp. BS20]
MEGGNYSKRRIHLLDAAEEIFASHGYKSSSIRQIATGAGLSVAMVSYYFESKENLLLAVILRRLDEYELKITDAVKSSGNIYQQLFIFINLSMELISEHRQFFRFLLNGLNNESPKEAVSIIKTFFRSNYTILERIINTGVKEKRLKIVDAELSSYVIFNALIRIVAENECGAQQSEVQKKNRIRRFFMCYFLDSAN